MSSFAEWDQQLFRWAWRAMRALGGRGRDDEGAVLFEPLRPRLEIVASALAETPIQLAGVDGAGGFSGDRVEVPERLRLGDDPADGALAFVFRVAYGVTSRRLACVSRLDGVPLAVATLVAARPTLAALRADLPGVAPVVDRVFSLALRVRPSPPSSAPGAWAIELLVRRVLGAEAPPPEAPAAAVAWAAEVFDLAAPTDEACAELAARLPRGARVVVEALFGSLRAPAPSEARLAREGEGPVPTEALPSGTERRAKTEKEGVREVKLPEDRRADNPLVHAFEKIQTLEEYEGGSKALDGADELDEHLEALEELDLRVVVRSRERTHSLYRADPSLAGGVPDLADGVPPTGAVAHYDEWDGRRSRYRERWCAVTIDSPPSRASLGDAEARVRAMLAARRREARRLEAELGRLDLARRPQPRQREGEEIDVDAVVDAHSTRVAGRTPSDRLYVRARRHAPDAAVLLLVDLSLSSDSWLDGRRVLDVARETLAVVGDVLSRRAVPLAIAGYHSNTRRDCRFVVVKSFEESWTTSRRRIAELTPAGYTRIGPAIRHATSVMCRQPHARRAVLVVTDGKPTDYDRYEGRYGVLDVQRAVREAARDRVGVFGLAITGARSTELGEMFGAGHYELLPKLDALPAAASRWLARLLRD